MFKISDYIKGNNRPETYLYLVLLVFLTLLALGNFDRYPIIGQLALANNFEDFKILYPNLNLDTAYGSSEYFPGVSYIIYFFKLFTPDIILLEMLLIFSILIMLFFFSLVKKIVNEIYPNSINFENYWLLASIITLWLCRDWLFYVITLKSDILAFSLIFYAFLLGKPHLLNENKNYAKLFFGLILIAYAITVKQQAIFVLVAISIYSLLNKNLFFKFYSFLIIIISLVIFYIFYKNDNLWFQTVYVISQDGFFSFTEILRIFYVDFISVLIFIIFLAFSSYHKLCSIDFNEKLNFLKKNLRSNIWFYLIISFAITGLISAVKRGGNTGNSQLALILFFPFIYIFLYNFKKTLLIFLVSALLILEIPRVIHNTNKYIQAKQFQFAVKNLIKEKNLRILSDKETYFGIFLIKKNNILISYDTLGIINNFVSKEMNKDSFHKKILSSNHDYILFAKNRIEKKLLNENGYKKIYENKLGLIFKKTL
jgi:hypothetical protein